MAAGAIDPLIAAPSPSPEINELSVHEKKLTFFIPYCGSDSLLYNGSRGGNGSDSDRILQDSFGIR